MGSKVTIYEVANAAGVGIGAVSRVLNNNTSVTPETRERVRKVMKQMNFQPHSYAQRLAKNHSETISIIIPFFTNYFFVEVLRGVQEDISRLGYDLRLFGVNDVDQVESKFARALQRGRVDGILFFSMQLPDKIVPRLRETGVPAVLVDSFYPKFDSISVANTDGAYDATMHLISIGHRKVSMINALQKSIPAAERLQGYKRALQSNGILYSEDIVKTGESARQDGFNRYAGYEAMIEFIKMGKEMPHALFVSSDIQATDAIAALVVHTRRSYRSRSLGIPRGLFSWAPVEYRTWKMAAVAGEMRRLALSSIYQHAKTPNLSNRPVRVVGRRAAFRLTDDFAGRGSPCFLL